MAQRLEVRKTYKLYLGGKFPRSESGRSYEVTDTKGRFLANAALASRKDARDAVVAARKAQPGWAGATAYNRGQVLYRVAEVMEGRRSQFVEDVQRAEGLTVRRAETAVDAAIDRWVWYAGWADKLAQVLGGTNPVAGPVLQLLHPRAHRGRRRRRAAGVVAARAGLGGRAGDRRRQHRAWCSARRRARLPAITLSEVMATSDLPGGVVNLLTGDVAEVAPWLASHMDVNAIDLAGVDDAALRRELEIAAADNVKRVRRPDTDDWSADPGLSRIRSFLETKTVWHPIGV